MSKITVALIGGHNDGRRVEIDPKYRKIKSGILPKTAPTAAADPDPVPVFTGSEVHEAMEFDFDGKAVTLFVLEGMTSADAIQRLIDHYRP